MAEEFPIDIVLRSSSAESAAARFDARLDAIEASSANINRQMQLVVDNTTQLGRGATGATRLASDLDRVETEAQGAAREIEAVQRAERSIGAQSGGAQDLAEDLEGVRDPANEASDAIERTTSRIGAYIIAAGAAAATAVVVGIIRQGDAYAQLEDRIRRVTAATGDFTQVRDSIFDIAFQSGQAVDTVNRVFESINRSRNELNASTDDILDVTRAVQQLGVISGASRTETQNALRQLSQGFSSDFLRAEEFNSILENTPEIAFRIARGLDVSLGTLQQMVRDGKVLSADVFQAILTQSQEINEEVEDIPIRLGRAFSQLGQATDEAFASIDRGIGGGSGAIAGFISDLAQATRVHTGNLNAIIDLENTLEVRLESARADLLELQENPSTFYRDNAAANVRAAELEVAALERQIAARDQATREDEREAAAQAQQIAAAQRLTDIQKTITDQTKNLAATREALLTPTERVLEAEERRNQAIENNPLGATIVEREELLRRSRAQTAEELEAIRSREEAQEEASANRVFAIRLQLADETERLILRQQQQERAITDDVSDVGLRDQLILESRIQLEEALDAIDQERADKNQAANDKFIEDLGELGRQTLEQILEQSIAEEELRRENELRVLEGNVAAEDAADLDRLQRLERFEEARLNIQSRAAGRFQNIVRGINTFEKQSATDKASFVLGVASSLTDGLAANSRAAFAIQKAANISLAIIDGITAVQGAIKDTPGGVYIKAAAGVAMGVIAAANVAKIASTNFGGSGGGGFGSFSGAAGGAPAINIPEALTVTGDTQEEALTTAAPQIIVQTEAIFTNDSAEMQEDIGPAALNFIRQETSEGDETVIDQGSRQALDLTT